MSLAVCAMQPYWIPYPGYFRLFNRANVFIVLDNVQFPRRGYVHRNKLRNTKGELEWITLPTKKAPRESLISEIELREDASVIMQDAKRRFPTLSEGYGVIDHLMKETPESLIDLVMGTLRVFLNLLDLESEIVFASHISTGPLTGQDRIIELVRRVGGTEYVNLAGGTQLYDPHVFSDQGIELSFLPPWEGDYSSILQQVETQEGADKVRLSILEQS